MDASVVACFVFILGAIVGSFLNVCIYRMPRDLSIVWPGSFCPHCEKPIAWYYNIPLVSFIFLRGKCAQCKKPIPVRYLLVEIVNALLWWLLWKQYGLSVDFVTAALFFSLLLVVILTDFETGLIPDLITFPGMMAGLLLSVIGNAHFPQAFWYQRLLASFIGLVVGGGILLLTGWFGTLVFRKDSMGGGDVKLLAMMGAFLGASNAGLIFLLAPFPALPFGLWQRYVKKEETIPFGPFLALSGALLFMHGNAFLNYVAKLYGV
ncbi:MAG TPA: prepilin peptidase [Candidatus Omnitrophota bacterium]|nr:prepilin peptidase [Candidatus Omnitrophota bacterium]